MEGYSSYTGSNGYPNNQSSGNVFALNQKVSFLIYACLLNLYLFPRLDVFLQLS